ncbi:MAG: amidohydrolase family protein [Phycisphaerales bacterium]|nr:amidohydrolase family protein [Phycisphaerales bacterium]
MHRLLRVRLGVFVGCCGACLFGWAAFAVADYEPPVLIKAKRIVVAPGQVIEDGQVLIHDGRIIDVGPSIKAPAEAVVFDASDLTVYPGLIDGLSQRGVEPAERSDTELATLADDPPDTTETVQSKTVEAYRRLVHPSWRAEERVNPEAAQFGRHRKGGFTAAVVAPPTAIFSGSSALILTGSKPLRREVIAANVAMHAAFVTRAGSGDDGPRWGRGYPSSKMGAIALMRQTLLDAAWHRDLLAWSKRNPTGESAPLDKDLEALWPALDGDERVAFLANSESEIHKALDIAAEFRLKPLIVGGREGWRAAERLKRENVPVILSTKWSDAPEIPKGPKRPTEDATTQPATQPTTRSADEGADKMSTTWAQRAPMFDDEWQDRAWQSRREFEEKRRQWGEEVDNAQRLHEAGVRFAFATFDLDAPDEISKRLRQAVDRGLPEDAALAALTSDAADLLGMSDSIGRVARGRIANLTLVTGPLFDKKSELRWVFVNGEAFRIGDSKRGGAGEGEKKGRRGFRGGPPKDEPVVDGPDKPADAIESGPSAKQADDEEASEEALLKKLSEIEWPEFACETEADRKPRIETGGDVMLRNATLLTIEDGDLPETDLLIRGGLIAEIGQDLPARNGVMEIDLKGYCISPGMIDPHSHMCITGGVNEGTLSATPEVRIRDVIDHRDIGAFRALAGGTTCIHTMHGSANTIGGQNAVLRLKFGHPASEWFFTEAPQTVKFALGENVKQSNGGGRRTRFPATRMGVEVVLRRSFDAALAYIDANEQFKRDAAARKDPRPVRRDLRLEALADVYRGTIWVHCHCYRADEVLRLLAVAEDYGFRIAVLQHILEGYRAIPEILRHGCSTSTFSDWWAYKIEAYNAIPQNAARLAQAGIVSTINSDSAEVVRHLNLEAAKSMHFGGLAPNDALRLATLNAAIELGIDKYVGSLKVGKRADIAIFDGHPLDTFSHCVLTLIDGEAYFQHPDFDAVAPLPPRDIKSFGEPYEPASLELGSSNETWLIDGTIHPVSGPVIENGYIQIIDGKIAAIGEGEASPSENANIIDLAGLHVYPGLINAGVQLGLVEIDSVAGTDDQAVLGTFQPDIQSLSAYDPFSEMVGVARSEGVLAALVPPSGGTISGQGGVVHLNGWSMPEARMIDSAGLFVDLPHLSENAPRWMDEKQKKQQREKYPEQIAKVEAFFRDATAYARAADAGAAFEKDRRFDAMIPYVTEGKRVFFRASSAKQIAEAMQFAEKFALRPVIFGGTEAWKLADQLAEKNIDVVIVRSMSMPRGRDEPFDSVYRNAAVLADAGVRFAFATAEPSLAKHIGIEAGVAVAFGLDEDRAIEAITLDAARILGVDDVIGSLEPGKSADLIVTSDSPMQASNCVVAAFIKGRPIDLDNRHTRMDRKWLARPEPELAPAPELRGPPPMRLEVE